ncbi:MAG TPA: hypothetical protein VEU47_01445 [Candidatus Cybelea sp.]|nr:hypothetical protein [Candidatus Cybelea sp.]
MTKHILALLLFGAALSGCASDKAKFVGFNSCAKDGSVVYYIYPNSQGVYDDTMVSPNYCRK